MELCYDPKWLAIFKKNRRWEVGLPTLGKIAENPADFLRSDEDLKQIEELFGGDYRIPLNFKRTGPPQHAYKRDSKVFGTHNYRNPQTKEFCEKLKIPDLNEQLCLNNMNVVGDPYYPTECEFFSSLKF